MHRPNRILTSLEVGFPEGTLPSAFKLLCGKAHRAIDAVDEFPFEGDQFDVVLLNGACLAEKIVREAHRVLKNDGLLYLSSEASGCPQVHETADGLYRTYLRHGFDLLSFEAPPWWRFGFGDQRITACARKKRWVETHGIAGASKLSFASAFAAFLVPVALWAGEPPQTEGGAAVIRLLNSRTAGSPRSYEEAAKTVLADAEAGRPLQQFVVGIVSRDPAAPEAVRVGREKGQAFLDASREKIRMLAEQRANPLAWYLLSLENNDISLLKRAADGGNVQALNAWGTITLTPVFKGEVTDSNKVAQAFSAAFKSFKFAADQEDPNGLYNTGLCYLNGYGCSPNPSLAYKCFVSAADAGHPEAINNLGGFYRDGVVVQKDLRKAAECFEKSAGLGNAYGQLNYALALQHGEGVDRDAAKAYDWLGKAAAQGNPEAMCAYGMCHYTGTGVAKDFKVAFRWFSRSAERGFPPAMENLSSCYQKGEGVGKDMDLATVWKIRARANAGDATAAAWLRQNGYSLR